ncbi:hypothetical protein T05_542 [Trichinella murrelli]|uniref:Uncharacterized protein n=1 Tax=Trichinella murrelli TaxID=144512 RepID=A0A0V0TGI3_9BILA|nr:hypothetical protein T05_542 [Trichinella murrelli]
MRVGRQKPTAVLAGGIFELGGRGGFTAAALRLPQLDLQLATPPCSNGCYTLIISIYTTALLQTSFGYICRQVPKLGK